MYNMKHLFKLSLLYCSGKARVAVQYFQRICKRSHARTPTIIEMNSSDDIESSPIISNGNKPLSCVQKIAYGFGHVFNDLCAAMWFSYLLFYFQIVLQVKSTTTGMLLMIGQISDAIATPIAGWAVDKYGTKTFWHLIGTIIVGLSFPLVFTACSICNDDGNNNIEHLFYYIFVIILFQIGWAIVQISHLSIIPSITNITRQRSELTAIRYTAAVCSNIITYVITWIVVQSGTKNNTTIIDSSDYYKFHKIVIIILIIGTITSLIFYSGIKRSHFHTTYTQNENPLSEFSIRNLFLSSKLYQISLLYVASRLYIILNLVYMPLYLDERVNLQQTENIRQSIASVPLVTFIASFVISFVLKRNSEYWGHKTVYMIGSIISMCSCLLIGFYLTEDSNIWNVYLVAILIGIGSSITVVSSLCLTADVIGPNSNCSASIYSIVTFTDKLICGIAVFIIEHIKCSEMSSLNPEYYRYVLAYVSGGTVLFGIIILITTLQGI